MFPVPPNVAATSRAGERITATTTPVDRLRVATHNVHRCKGLDRRIMPERIVKVLRELHADIIALQEVWSKKTINGYADQARFISEQLGLSHVWTSGPFDHSSIRRLAEEIVPAFAAKGRPR